MSTSRLLSARKSNRFLGIGSELGILFYIFNLVYTVRRIYADAKNIENGGSNLGYYQPWLYILLLVSFLASSVLIIIGLVIYFRNHETKSKLKLYLLPSLFGLYTGFQLSRQLIYLVTFGNIPVGALYTSHVISFVQTDSILAAIFTSLTIILSILALIFFSSYLKELRQEYSTNAKQFLISPYINGLALLFYIIALIVGAVLYGGPTVTEETHVATYFTYMSSLAFIELAYFVMYLELTFKLIYSRPNI